ncbi:adipocyte enhancer-binding protein 1-like [Anneissia japonica]|uniref:adipocyte enhancer-binding protein 1-like n=1 Tax=Anneissia japonica TaxID=1529436 RepID=UPI001425B7DE|nr:adipocyte enhancer-binding protein 1-like [Anneissia japonica]
MLEILSLVFVISLLINSSVVSELCIDPLGIEDGTIPTEQLSASSEFDLAYGAHRGRLNTATDSGGKGAWSSKTNDQYQWIQVDLGKLHKVRGVITQGRNSYDQWVTFYEILYSVDGDIFQPIRNSDCQVSKFVGNSDEDTTVTNMFSEPIYANFVRIHPTDWYRHISLRFEILGCPRGSQLVGHSTYYKSFRQNSQRSIMTRKSSGSCIRCAVECMRTPEFKYFKCDGGCRLYTCSNDDNFVGFQIG